MGGRLPDFIVIGAMKCGTSSLHAQLARRPGLFLSEPKEPNFFSDDVNYRQGLDWYTGLFASAREGQLCGESSTHYTKLPTHPHSLERMRLHLPHARLVFVMRDPIDRIVSQYLHEWSQREVEGTLEDAVRCHERFVAYSSYAFQLEPFLRSYGAAAVLPVAFERMLRHPDEELARICAFLGDPSPGAPRWDPELGARNASIDRLRRNAVLELVRASPVLRALKRCVPRAWRERIKDGWRVPERPALPHALRSELETRLDGDLARLGAWLGVELTCRTWRTRVLERPLVWVAPPGRAA
jgi:hypothetical protein